MSLKELKANGFGIISFILALLNIGIIIFTTFHDFQQIASGDLVFIKQDLYITWFMIISSFIGAILGIIGITRKEQKKYAINGLVVNVIPVLIFIF